MTTLESLTECICISEHCVSRKSQRFDRSLCRFGMPAAAGVFYDDRNDTQVGSVSGGWFNSDLHRDAHQGHRCDAAITQCDRQGRPL